MESVKGAPGSNSELESESTRMTCDLRLGLFEFGSLGFHPSFELGTALLKPFQLFNSALKLRVDRVAGAAGIMFQLACC
jgi:hypothetical protein